MTKNNQTVTIDPLLVPDSQLALQQFQSHGGHIMEFSSFGHDPLEGNLELFRRESRFLERYSDFGPFFPAGARSAPAGPKIVFVPPQSIIICLHLKIIMPFIHVVLEECTP